MRLFCFILCLVILSSCKKDDKAPIKGNLTILAGQAGDSVNYFDFNPNICINYTEVYYNSYFGEKSIDINNDNNSDFKVTYRVVLPDLNNSCCNATYGDCFPNGYNEITLERLNKSYQIATGAEHIIQQFIKDEKIDRYSNWDTCTTVYFANSTFPAMTNNWKYKTDKYIGVRLVDTDTIYGWIKLTYIDTITFEDCGFKKLN